MLKSAPCRIPTLEIARRIEGVQRMQRALTLLVHDCEATGHAKPCTVSAALSGTDVGYGVHGKH